MAKINLIQRSKSALCLISVLVLSSCTTLGPEFEEPEISWLNEWQSGSISQSEPSDFDAAIVQSWWRQFDDPVLVSLIQAAQKDNLSLRIAGLRILESRAVQGLVGSSLLPQLQQVSGASDVVTTRQSGGGNTNQIATQFQGVLGWELDFWGRFQRAVESADASFFASVSQQRDLQVLIAAQMARLYFSYKVTERRIVITRFNASIQQRSFEITQERFTEGDESELDFQQARTQYLATLSVIPQLELSLRNTRNAICVLLGKPPESIPELAESAFELPIVDPATISDFPAELLTLRPDVRVAAWQVAAQSAQIGIAEAEYYPSISILGSLGWSGTSLNGIPNASALSVGPAVRWNLFDHGAIENNIRIQNARLQQSIEAFQSTVLEAAREVDNATFNLLKTAEQQLILDESVDAARRALEIANTRYREGYSDFQRVLSAQRAYFNQVERQILNHGSHLNTVVSLYQSLGGGWEPKSLEEMIPEEVRRKMSASNDWGDLFEAPLIDKPTTRNKDSQNE